MGVCSPHPRRGVRISRHVHQDCIATRMCELDRMHHDNWDCFGSRQNKDNDHRNLQTKNRPDDMVDLYCALRGVKLEMDGAKPQCRVRLPCLQHWQGAFNVSNAEKDLATLRHSDRQDGAQTLARKPNKPGCAGWRKRSVKDSRFFVRPLHEYFVATDFQGIAR